MKRGAVGAFFDLDGTLVAGPSLERRLFRALRYARVIRAGNYFRWLKEAVRLAPQGIGAIRHANKMYLRGVAADSLRREIGKLSFFAEGIDRMAWHARQGHRIVIVSGTLEPLAWKAARDLEKCLAEHGVIASVDVLATQLEEKEARWTGQIVGEAMFGEAKARAVKRLAAEIGLDLQRSYAHGDSANDRWLLAMVGHPTAINPSRRLARIAHANGWPVEEWGKEEKESTQRAQSPQRVLG